MAKLPQGTQIDPAISLNVGIKAFNAGKMDAALKEFAKVPSLQVRVKLAGGSTRSGAWWTAASR